MTEMKILPTDRAVEWIRAWAELDWPITWETAYAVRDKLGWTPNPEDPELFTTELTVNQKGGYMASLDDRCSGVSIPLTSFNVLGEHDNGWVDRVWKAYNLIQDRLTNLYGNGTQTADHTDIVQTDWILPSRVTISLIGSAEGIDADIDSPEVTEINQWDSYFVEKYGEDYVDD